MTSSDFFNINHVRISNSETQALLTANFFDIMTYSAVILDGLQYEINGNTNIGKIQTNVISENF